MKLDGKLVELGLLHRERFLHQMEFNAAVALAPLACPVFVGGVAFTPADGVQQGGRNPFMSKIFTYYKGAFSGEPGVVGLTVSLVSKAVNQQPFGRVVVVQIGGNIVEDQFGAIIECGAVMGEEHAVEGDEF